MNFFWLKVCSTFEMWTQSCNLYGRNCFILIRSLSFHEYLINDVPIWKCRNTKQLLRQHNVAKNFMKSNQNSELLLYNLRLQTKVKYSKVHYKAHTIYTRNNMGHKCEGLRADLSGNGLDWLCYLASNF